MRDPECRFCRCPLQRTVLDLGMAPSASAFVPDTRAAQRQEVSTLRALLCEQCWLLQQPEVVTAVSRDFLAEAFPAAS